MIFFLPFMILFFFIFMFILFIFFFLVKWGIIGIAFSKLGIPPDTLFLTLFLSMVGSAINIPVKRIRVSEVQPLISEVTFWGIRYRVPVIGNPREIVIAVNVGGALIPVLLSLYLFSITSGHFAVLLSSLAVTFVVNRLARPILGIGIGIPMFIPPVTAALCALILAPEEAPRVAYISGTIGTLIGADLLNLNKVKSINAPVLSIGGAGSFDGIFLTGIIAVLLA